MVQAGTRGACTQAERGRLDRATVPRPVAESCGL